MRAPASFARSVGSCVIAPAIEPNGMFTSEYSEPSSA